MAMTSGGVGVTSLLRFIVATFGFRSTAPRALVARARTAIFMLSLTNSSKLIGHSTSSSSPSFIEVSFSGSSLTASFHTYSSPSAGTMAYWRTPEVIGCGVRLTILIVSFTFSTSENMVKPSTSPLSYGSSSSPSPFISPMLALTTSSLSASNGTTSSLTTGTVTSMLSISSNGTALSQNLPSGGRSTSVE